MLKPIRIGRLNVGKLFLRLAFIVLTVLFVFLTSGIENALQYKNAAAAPSGPTQYDAMGLDDQFLSNWYYDTLSQCFNNAVIWNRAWVGWGSATSYNTDGTNATGVENVTFSASKVTSGNWLNVDNNKAHGIVWPTEMNLANVPMRNYLSGYKDDEGETCSSKASEVLTAALKLWNISAIDLACGYNSTEGKYIDGGSAESGYIFKRTNGSSCMKSSDDFKFGSYVNNSSTFKSSTIGDYFKKYILDQVYKGNSPGNWQSQASGYLMYLSAFMNSCADGSSAQASSPGGDPNTIAMVPNIEVSNGNSVITPEYYILASKFNGDTLDKNKTEIPLYNNPHTEHTCAYIVEQLNPSNGKGAATAADAYIAYLKAHPDKASSAQIPAQGSGSDCSTNPAASGCTTSCAVTGVGWIVCPILTFMGTVSDYAFNFLSAAFLNTNPQLLSTDSKSGNDGTYVAWQSMRTLANAIFIVVFLIMIFSQVTNVGISNYGLKKMFPRLIAVAILVNISFLVCQVSVDLSNIFGYSIKDVLNPVSGFIKISSDSVSTNSAKVIGGRIAVILAGAAGAGILLLAISLPVVLAVVLALLMTVLILIARTALIVILTFLSPLAFAAYLLPNTEFLFKKWWKLYSSLLLVFPVISLLFGGGSIAAYILNAVDSTDGWMGLVAIGAAVLPLFAVPVILQNSMKAMGGIGAKLSGWSARAGANIGQKVKTDSKLGTGWSESMNYRHQQRSLRYAQGRGNFASGKFGQSRLGRLGYSVLGGHNYQQYVTTRGTALADAEFENDVKAAESYQQGKSSNDRMMIATGSKSSEAEQVAAVRYMMKNGSYDERKSILQYVGSGAGESLKKNKKEKVLTAINDGYYASGDQKYFGSALGGDILAGNKFNVNNRLRQQIEDGKISPSAVVSDASATRDMSAIKGSLSDHGKDNLVNAVRDARTLPTTREKINDQFKKQFNTIDPEEQNNKTEQSNEAAPSGGTQTSSEPWYKERDRREQARRDAQYQRMHRSQSQGTSSQSSYRNPNEPNFNNEDEQQDFRDNFPRT